ncbi:MAG: hypothetical protein ACRD3H_03145 [Terriglobales bacterium]|jgi:hypothetical protein|nr:hypothetical protein [Terriglobales bacterium]
MAAKLLDCYARVSSEFGLTGRIKLAMLTKISSEKAASEADSEENIMMFEQAVIQIRAAPR